MKRIITIICIVQTIVLYGKDPYNYIHYRLDDGLPSETVYDIEQDDEGYIWVATEAGLSRYNGKQFVNFTTKDGLFKNEVVNLSNDTNGKIWLNLSGPYSYIENNQFTSFDHKVKNDINWNLNALHNGNNITWITSRNNLFYSKNKELKLNENPWIKNYEIKHTHIIGRNNKDFYIFLNNNILQIQDTLIVDTINLKISKQEGSFRLQNTYFEYPNIYYFNEGNLFYYSLEKETSQLLEKNIDQPRALEKIGNNIILTHNKKGFTSLELDSTLQVKNRTEKLTQTYISTLKVDKDLNLWLSSSDNGLFLYPDFFKKKKIESSLQQFQNYNCELIKVYNDTIWIGTRDGSLIRKTSTGTKIFKMPVESQHKVYLVKDLVQISNDLVLISTDFGLYLFDGETFNHIMFTASKKLFKKDNTVLVGNYKSLLRSTTEKIKKINVTKTKTDEQAQEFVKVQDGRVYTSLIDRNNNIYAVHSLKGLLKITDDEEIQLNKKSPLFNANIVELIEDNSGIIYAATIGDGIILIDSETNDYTTINTEDGISSNVVYALSFSNNKLYAGTNRGLSIINNPISFFENKNSSIEVYNTKNGLLSNEIKDIEVSNTGIHLVGATGYLNFNTSNSIKSSTNDVIIESIKVNDEFASADRLKGMPNSKNDLHFTFTGLQFGNELNYNYAYRLNNFDENWIITKSTEAIYRNLSPGDYTFEVTLLQNGEIDIDAAKRSKVELSINPHFTNSWWFMLLIALFTLFVLYLIFYAFINKRQKKMLKKMVNKKTYLLNNKIEELALINDELGRSNRDLKDFAHICSHDLKSPLRSISSFSELLYKRFKISFNKDEIEYYNFVQSGIKKMNQVINDLMAHSKISSDKTISVVNFNVVISEIDNELKLFFKQRDGQLIIDSDFPILNFNRTQAYQLLKNLIYNGLKYNNASQPIVNVGCSLINEHYFFYVKDNGIGIEEEYFDKIFNMFRRLHTDEEYEGTGIGLAICQRIIEKFKGKIWVESSKNEGSTFYFTIPKNLAYNQSLSKVG